MGKQMVIGFIATLIMGYILATVIGVSGLLGMWAGAQVGAWLWLGLVATVLLNGVLWKGEPFNFYLLNVAYWLVNLAVMGAILGAWP